MRLNLILATTLAVTVGKIYCQRTGQFLSDHDVPQTYQIQPVVQQLRGLGPGQSGYFHSDVGISAPKAFLENQESRAAQLIQGSAAVNQQSPVAFTRQQTTSPPQSYFSTQHRFQTNPSVTNTHTNTQQYQSRIQNSNQQLFNSGIQQKGHYQLNSATQQAFNSASRHEQENQVFQSSYNRQQQPHQTAHIQQQQTSRAPNNPPQQQLYQNSNKQTVGSFNEPNRQQQIFVSNTNNQQQSSYQNTNFKPTPPQNDYRSQQPSYQTNWNQQQTSNVHQNVYQTKYQQQQSFPSRSGNQQSYLSSPQVATMQPSTQPQIQSGGQNRFLVPPQRVEYHDAQVSPLSSQQQIPSFPVRTELPVFPPQPLLTEEKKFQTVAQLTEQHTAQNAANKFRYEDKVENPGIYQKVSSVKPIYQTGFQKPQQPPSQTFNLNELQQTQNERKVQQQKGQGQSQFVQQHNTQIQSQLEKTGDNQKIEFSTQTTQEDNAQSFNVDIKRIPAKVRFQGSSANNVQYQKVHDDSHFVQQQRFEEQSHFTQQQRSQSQVESLQKEKAPSQSETKDQSEQRVQSQSKYAQKQNTQGQSQFGHQQNNQRHSAPIHEQKIQRKIKLVNRQMTKPISTNEAQQTFNDDHVAFSNQRKAQHLSRSHNQERAEVQNLVNEFHGERQAEHHNMITMVSQTENNDELHLKPQNLEPDTRIYFSVPSDVHREETDSKESLNTYQHLEAQRINTEQFGVKQGAGFRGQKIRAQGSVLDEDVATNSHVKNSVTSTLRGAIQGMKRFPIKVIRHRQKAPQIDLKQNHLVESEDSQLTDNEGAVHKEVTSNGPKRLKLRLPTQESSQSTVTFEDEKETQEDIARKQAENAQYSFQTSFNDTIHDNSQTREEVRDGLRLKGLYSYSDGYYKRTVHYVADENGYRVVKEDSEPIGDGPLLDPKGQIDLNSNVNGRTLQYTVTAADLPNGKRNQYDDETVDNEESA